MKKTAVIFIVWIGMGLSFAGQVLGYTEAASNNLFGVGAGANLGEDRYATFIGGYAGFNNTTGNSNTFLGYMTGYFNTTGSSNTFLGYNAGLSNTTGNSNTFLGRMAGNNNTEGYNNTFIGRSAGYANTTGSSNTFLGYNAGSSNTTGGGNIFLGFYAGNNNTEGYNNTFLGNSAGSNNTEGASNIFIGYRAGYNETGSNKLYIDNTGTGIPLIYGEFDNDLVKIRGTLEMVANVAVSDVRMKKNIQPLNASLNKVSMLEGVSFDWKTTEYADRGLSDHKQIGLIAQDVEKVLPELVRTGSNGYKSVSYAKLTAVLVEAVKELKSENQILKGKLEDQMKVQQAQLKKQQAQMKEQQAMLEAILKDRAYSSLSSKSNICMAAGGAQ